MNGLNLTKAMEALIKFRSERDWSKFHTPKNLSISIAIESAELMEHFQWRTDEETKEYIASSKFNDIREEIADIASYLLLLANDLDIDLCSAMLEKIKKNEEKYPVDICKGKHDKYTEL
jgi:NTP pyrophosphatase (non-canonical NTP hydrolase)